MPPLRPLSLGLGMLLALGSGALRASEEARLQELLQDRQQPAGQTQAALLLVQSRSPTAEDFVRDGLRQSDSPEVFLALAAALRLCQDTRFVDELVDALSASRPAVRQAAAETLAVLPEPPIVLRLQNVAEDTTMDLAARQAALWALGRCGRKGAAVVLLDQLSCDNEAVRCAAADALAELTGENHGLDLDRWRAWWAQHKDITPEHWLEERLAFQASRARRLDSELERARSQVVRLHQQLHARLPAADRLAHVQALVESEDPAVRVLAAEWAVELLATTDALGQRSLADLLLQLSRDGSAEVRKPAVHALGKVTDPRVLDRLTVLLRHGAPAVRAAAARSLAQQAHGSGPEAAARQRRVVPALQKALEDSSLEVVVAAAEELGALGVPEAGPVLAGLLRHPFAPVRQTAAQALERVADLAMLDTLLEGLDDPAVTVRFSLVGAVGHAAGDGKALTDVQRAALLARLELVLRRDADAGVRSRAATVLGECGTPAVLPVLWKRARAGEDSRVQEKAWGALLEILARSARLDLVQEWDHTLTEAGQGPRRVQLLNEVWTRWSKRDETRGHVVAVQEMLVQAQLDQGKWAAAFPLVRDLLARGGTDAETERRLRWLLGVGELALKEGNRAEALRAVEEAQAPLTRIRRLADDFTRLEKQAHANQ
jgi:HEAT repeat protein